MGNSEQKERRDGCNPHMRRDWGEGAATLEKLMITALAGESETFE
jgi:hypothetical protein